MVISVIISLSVVMINSKTNLNGLLIVITVDRALTPSASMAGVEVDVAALGMTAKSESLSGSG